MKKSTLITGISITISCLSTIFQGCNSVAGSNSGTNVDASSTTKTKSATDLNPNSYCALPGEDTINLIPDTMHVSTANGDFNLMSQTIFTNISGTNKPIDTVDNKIDTAYFRTLYNKAVGLGTGTGTTRMVTVIQIKYGIHNNTIRLYYKPLCLAWDGTQTIKGVVYNQYSNHHPFDSNYYLLTANGFQVAGYKLHFIPDSTSYVTNIRLKHQKTQMSPTGFNWSTDSTGDVRCGFYPFQEIYGLIKSNPNCDTIKVSNIAESVLVVTSSSTPYIKHAVILGPKNFTLGGSGLFYNIYADLESLCPPQCTTVLYQIE